MGEETFKDRLFKEQQDLAIKIEKLHAFMNSDAFGGLDFNQRSLLEIQLKAMETYFKILAARISLLVPIT